MFANSFGGADDFKANVWDVASGELVQGFEEVTSVCFANNGRVFTSKASRVLGGRDNGIFGQLWIPRDSPSPETGGLEAIANYEGEVSLVDDANFFFLIDDNVLRIVNTLDGRIRKLITNVSFGVVRPKHKRQILTDYSDNTARIWDTKSGLLVSVLEGHAAPVISASFNASGEWIATGSGDNTVRVWQIQKSPELTLTAHSGQIKDAFFSNCGKRAISASWNPKGATIHDIPVDDKVVHLGFEFRPVDCRDSQNRCRRLKQYFATRV